MTRHLPSTPLGVGHQDSNNAVASSDPNKHVTTQDSVDILILGAGWTFEFLGPLLASKSIPYAATTTSGRDGTIPFRFDPDSSDLEPYKKLPVAKTVLITFPLQGNGQSKKLVELYTKSRPSSAKDQHIFYIQLGSTGIFTDPHWNTFESSYNKENSRAKAEDELLSLSKEGTNIGSAVLNLSGLYGGKRDPKSWLPRVIKKKSDIAGKKALHLVHGDDVARAILAAHQHQSRIEGRRWIVTDLHVYDWWDLIYEWSGLIPNGESMVLETEEQGLDSGVAQKEEVVLKKAVLEFMEETGVRALPRSPETLGRVLDGRDFWQLVETWPSVGRVR